MNWIEGEIVDKACWHLFRSERLLPSPFSSRPSILCEEIGNSCCTYEYPSNTRNQVFFFIAILSRHDLFEICLYFASRLRNPPHPRYSPNTSNPKKSFWPQKSKKLQLNDLLPKTPLSAFFIVSTTINLKGLNARQHCNRTFPAK